MSRKMGYRFLTPRRAEITRRIGGSAEGPFNTNESDYSAFKVGIKHAKNALSSACSSFWKYIFPPAQIGVISRDAFSSLKKIQPISEFIEDSIPQPKPLHVDTGTLVPTPGRFEISDSAFKRPIEEITPYQAKRVKNEEIIAPIVIEKPVVVNNEPFRQPAPENKIKIPPWKKMQIRVGERQIKSLPVVKNEYIRPAKIEENVGEKKVENIKVEKVIEVAKQEEKIKMPEIIANKEEFKPVPLEAKEEKEKISEEPSSESQKIKEPLSPTMSFGDQSQNPDTISPTPKKLNDTSQNSFYIKDNKPLEKINEEKTEETVKTEHSTPKFDKEISEPNKNPPENAVKFEVPIKIDPAVKNPFEGLNKDKNPFEGLNKDKNPFEGLNKDKNPFVSQAAEIVVKPKEDEKPVVASTIIEEPPKIPPPVVSNPFLSSSTSAPANNTANIAKPLFVFGANNNSSGSQPSSIPNPYSQSSSQNPFGSATNPFATSMPPSASIQFGQSTNPPIQVPSIPNPFATTTSLSSAPNPFATSTNPPITTNPYPPSISPITYQPSSLPPTISPIPYQAPFGNNTQPPFGNNTQPPYGNSQSNFNQNFQTGNNTQNRVNFPTNANYDMDMGNRAPEISNPFGNQPFPQNSAPVQGTFNIGALPNNNRKILRAKRP